MKRYAFVDWFRGLACVLMFQTHAYDSWTAAASRNGWLWWTSRHLGGFPSRLFLLLAGVSLMLRFDGDRRRGVAVAASRAGAAKRGLEVLALGFGFRLFEWVLAGAGWSYVSDIWRVDILNCIGLSLIVAAYVASPSDLEEGRLPLRTAAVALAVVFLTPFVERLHFPAWAPRPLTAYLAGSKPVAFFPLFPWLAYVLAGCVAGAVWVRAARADKLGRAMAWTTAVGLGMALIGQLGHRTGVPFYSFGDNQAPPTSPTAFFYRTGMCLVGGALAYLATRGADPAKFSWLRQLGRTSLFVYWIHVELVYGHLSDPIKRKLSMLSASLLLMLLTMLMVLLSIWRTERFDKWRRARLAATAEGTARSSAG
ncbi:MAG TPA: heparan-alpha-glucosaminide N-acetyltransferase domain-containing protein [Polyangia bacterium]|nr:heparan-alpha-glucosaminide N-acetyltransferase domain-containing protein [Polyangia bacterium]